MDISYLKNYILENNLITTILENLGCHNIKDKSEYITASNPDGDSPAAITVYKNPNLTTIDYTRVIGKESIAHDLFDLVKFFEQCNFFESLKRICDWIELDYYADPDEDIPESLKITRLLIELNKDSDYIDEDRPIKPISEHILAYYNQYVNEMFAADGIGYAIQQEFEIGYDAMTNRITIPIRDELGNLVGVKGRWLDGALPEDQLKYYYLEPCNRSKVLYGLYKSMPYIERQGKVYVTESEKGVMQLWSMGIYNAVGTGGKKISSSQIEKITRLCVDVVFLFDKDVSRQELESIAERFIDSVKIYAIIDTHSILTDKESPTDSSVKFQQLLTECIERIR